MSARQKECLSYVVVDDCGYAPNPFGGVATLAACKPLIRRTAQEGDLIVGLAPKAMGYGLVYAMVVEEVLKLGDYYLDPRFSHKKPNFKSSDRYDWMGDNFYERTEAGYIQHPSAHNIEGREAAELEARMARDLSGVNVLISGLFYYFGKDLPKLPSQLDFLQVGRGHKKSGTEGIRLFEKHTAHLLKSPGVHGEPRSLNQEARKLEHLS